MRGRYSAVLLLSVTIFFAASGGAGAGPKVAARGEEGLSAKEAESLIRVEFGGLLAAEDSFTPWFVVGDFNGDKINDLAASVKLVGRLSEGDKRNPPFTLDKAPLVTGEESPANQTSPREYRYTLGDLARYRNERMLAVIHGSRGSGLRGARPSQKFVILDAADVGAKQMKLHGGKLPQAVDSGDLTFGPPPKLAGQAILLLIRGIGSAVFWNGSRYEMYPIDGPVN